MDTTSARTNSADAELIGLCAAFDQLTLLELSLLREGPNFIEEGDPRDQRMAEIGEDQWPLMQRLIATPAVSAEGLRAKARSLVLWDEDLLTPSSHLFGERMIASIFSDLLAAEPIGFTDSIS